MVCRQIRDRAMLDMHPLARAMVARRMGRVEELELLKGREDYISCYHCSSIHFRQSTFNRQREPTSCHSVLQDPLVDWQLVV